MSELALFILVAIGSVLVSSVSQMMLKISANKQYESSIKEYLNPWVICAYILFFGSTLIMVFAYKVLPLSLGPVVEALGYVFVGVLGFVVLKEKITRKKALGMVLIVIGVVVCSLG